MRDIVEYFEDYADTSIDPKPFASPADVYGVRISCRGDMKTFGNDKYSSRIIHSRHSIFYTAATSSIADRLGVPLLVEQLPPDQSWREGTSVYTDRQDPYPNQEATFLFLNIDPTFRYKGGGHLGWGFAPMRWQNNVGSVIVARRDREPLNPFDVEIICAYCRRYVLPLTENATGAGLGKKTKAEVLAKISPSTFAAFRLEYSQKQRELRGTEERLRLGLGRRRTWPCLTSRMIDRRGCLRLMKMYPIYWLESPPDGTFS
ncbi:MAG: hypothetical protein Q9221_004209 [Calogaya cf. arnoldii]